MKKVNFTPFPELETNHLRLRQLKIWDQSEIFALKTDSEVSRYIERILYKKIEDAQNFIYKINDGIEKNIWVFWAITLRDTDKLIGTICLWNICEEDSKAEIGYELMPEYQGRGIMQEAMEATIKYGFETMRIRTVEAYTHRDNLKSIRLLERNGFIKVNGKLLGDNVVYELRNK